MIKSTTGIGFVWLSINFTRMDSLNQLLNDADDFITSSWDCDTLLPDNWRI